MKTSGGLETRTAECAKHGTFEMRVIAIGGRELPGRCARCVDEERAQEAASARLERKRTLAARVELPPRYVNRTFANYRPVNAKAKTVLRVCERYVDAFEERRRHGGGLVLCGHPGTGKTHLAAAIAHAVIERHMRSVLYTTVAAAVRYVKQTYAPGAPLSEGKALERFQKPELLILDEVGMQRGTDYETQLLAELLNERYAAVLPTLLLSNYTHDALADFIGARAIDRMREGGGAVLAFDWESYRVKVESDENLSWPALVPVEMT